MPENAESSTKKKGGLRDYLVPAGLGGALGSIPDIIIAELRTRTPEYVRQIKLEDFSHPALVLIPIGIGLGLGIKYALNRRGERIEEE